MASSSSAKKVAKLASRGKGKKVRFSSGTTYPLIVACVSIAMVVLVAYSKWSMPSETSGPPQAGDQWTMAYSFRVCDTQFTLTGQPTDLTDDQASAGDANQLQAGQSSDAGFINYRPVAGGDTGSKARLSVFLDTYGVKLNNKKLELPESQVGEGEQRVWDIDDEDVFKGTSCEGQDAIIKVRVWKDATSNSFEDRIVDLANTRFTNNGMAMVIAVVPDDNDFDIPKPPTWSQLEDFGAIGANSGTTDTTTPTGDTGPVDTGATDTTPAGSTPDTTG